MANPTDEKVVLTGAQMREILFPKLDEATAALLGNQPKTGDIARRMVRVFLRYAAKLGVSVGMNPDYFIAESIEAIKNEMAKAAPVAVEAAPEVEKKDPGTKTFLN